MKLWPRHDEDWRWRLRIARFLAAEMDAEHLGVKAIYLFGSTKNAEAGPESDIDLLVHVTGNPAKRSKLEHWMEAWDARLCEVLHSRGYGVREQLLDVHYITDEDIERGESFAVHIDAVDDPARRLKLGKKREG
jgi:predicted nucleotidyltransferase